jgi:hypothetical protein
MRQRLRLGALHVGLVAGQPEQARGRAGDARTAMARRSASANVQEFQAVIVHAVDLIRRLQRGKET